MHDSNRVRPRIVTFGEGPLTIEDVVDLAYQRASAALSSSATVRARLQRGADFVDRLLAEDGVIYGVTTGYGDSCTVVVPPELIEELPERLFTYHGCGLGEFLTVEQTRAVMATRLASLAQGFSGVSLKLLEQLTNFLQHDILPLIPAEGSVGASGDLTPLSYVAAALCGQRDVIFHGERMSAMQALHATSLEPLRLRPKEGLALMNGTSVMTALACLAYDRAMYVSAISTRITALASVSLDGNPKHFDKALFAAKPHVGQQRVAARLRDDLAATPPERNEHRLQDRYSIRCAPHVIGVLEDASPWLRSTIENELNSANDNPLIDPDAELVLHGGHFYGGHIAFAMDGLKTLIANIADLLDRQFALLVDQRFNSGLASNLSGAQGIRKTINHGLKAVQIASSAWTAEALKHTMPASVFSRSTECHNQDKVSMGTIAARDCLRVLDLTDQVIAALLLAVRQGIELRSAITTLHLTDTMSAFVSALNAQIPFIVEDRALDRDLRDLVSAVRAKTWTLYA